MKPAQPIKPYLLFDAGGTLIFPDQAFMIQQGQGVGLTLTHDQLFGGYCHLIHRLDCHARDQGRLPDIWPQGYVQALFDLLDLTGPTPAAVVQACQARHRYTNFWSFTFAWVPETLAQLAGQGYRMAVISNSDGRIAEAMAEAGLAPYFDRIFDSGLLGVEKPDPAIFEIVLAELDLSPAAALYIGDVFHIDVAGANRAGLGCLHLDPLGLYHGWPGVHLPDLRHVPAWLARYAAEPLIFDLFPISRPAQKIEDRG